MIDTLVTYFSFPFVRYAFIVGILISLCSSLLGVTLVLKRFSFIGDGLSHVAFGGICLATVLGTFIKIPNDMYIVLPLTVLCAVLLLRTGKNTKIQGDAAVAMISVASLAIGYLLMNIFSTSSNNRRRLQYPLRLNFNSYTYARRGLALHGTFHCSHNRLHNLL